MYQLSTWFDRGVANGHRYMSIYWDTYDGEDYPVYFKNAEDYFKREDQLRLRRERGDDGDTLMEVYDLTMCKQTQLNAQRVYNGPKRMPDQPKPMTMPKPEKKYHAPRRSARLAVKAQSASRRE